MISNKRDKDDKYSERLWSLLCICRKMMKRLIALLAFEKDKCFVFQTLGFRLQSLPLFIGV